MAKKELYGLRCKHYATKNTDPEYKALMTRVLKMLEEDIRSQK